MSYSGINTCLAGFVAPHGRNVASEFIFRHTSLKLRLSFQHRIFMILSSWRLIQIWSFWLHCLEDGHICGLVWRRSRRWRPRRMTASFLRFPIVFHFMRWPKISNASPPWFFVAVRALALKAFVANTYKMTMLPKKMSIYSGHGVRRYVSSPTGASVESISTSVPGSMFPTTSFAAALGYQIGLNLGWSIWGVHFWINWV